MTPPTPTSLLEPPVPDGQAASVRVEDLTFAYPGCEPVIRGFGLQAQRGERVALVGPSGCGKTTLLRVLEGSLAATSGHVERQGRVVLAYQDLRLVEESTLLDNVTAGALGEQRGWRRWFGPSADLKARARRLLADVGLGGKDQRRVSELSGGQKQRVALARALCAQPDVLLCDEPFANLDGTTARRVAELLVRLQEKYGFALVCSVHDLPRVQDLFTRTVELTDAGCAACPLAPAISRKTETPSVWHRVMWAGVALALLGSVAALLPTLPRAQDALREGGRLLAGLVPWPLSRLTEAPWGSLLESLLVTVQMALVGTAAGVLLSAPLAILASLPGGSKGVSALARGIASVIRAVPSLLWALLAVAVVGIGPAAGVVALAAYSTGYLTRMFADALEDTDQRPARVLRQMGASPFQAWRRGLFRPALPNLSSAMFFVFEYNVRGASVLGLVGAGGIGKDLAYYVEWRDFGALSAALLLVIAVAVGLDAVSKRLRRSLTAARGQ
jgi:phosphonate transport system permease protein